VSRERELSGRRHRARLNLSSGLWRAKSRSKLKSIGRVTGKASADVSSAFKSNSIFLRDPWFFGALLVVG